MTAKSIMMAYSKDFWPRDDWSARSNMEATPMMMPPMRSGSPKRRLRATAPPMTSAMSVAPATTSAWTQNSLRRWVPKRLPRSSGRLCPVAKPSFADWYCTRTAMMFAATRTTRGGSRNSLPR
ncbi:hypothetical protein AHiyo8_61830 [Arthrobacter sp. Hiyo8]|nr:hypothetical protein AHiyo8_61830 [Arthrobacter sp. Hiyo8]